MAPVPLARKKFSKEDKIMPRYFRSKRINKSLEIEDSIMTVTQAQEATIEAPFEKRGLKSGWYFVVAILVVLAGRILYLDSFRGGFYNTISEENRIRKIAVKAPRGEIMDYNGKVLARNIPSLDAIIMPSYLPDSSDIRQQMSGTLANILSMDPGNVEAILESQDKNSPDPVLLKENITQDESLILSEKIKDLPGIAIDETAIRSYESGPVFAPIIGYDGKITREELSQNSGYSMIDYIGKTGLEKSYESSLRGTYGAEEVEVDSLGNMTRDLGLVPPQPGSDLILNIDADLQQKLYDSLSAMLVKSGSKTAAAVAINPQNGGVLAMVSLPSYDNNLFARGISNDDYKNLINDSDLPLFNRVIAGEYPPGSTIKPAIATAALAEGTITPQTIIDGQGGAINIGSFHFGDWKAHAPSDVRTAIAQSNDVFFYTVGGGYGNIAGLGMDRMKKYENLYGFGNPTGIDIPGESTGLIPSEQWKMDKFGEKWYIGDSYHCAIGQGFVTVTPLQLANYVATIANGGTLYSPRIVDKIRAPNGQEIAVGPQIIRQNFVSSDIIQVVREGMRQTVTDGTAQVLKNMPVPVAGKTGTAQFGTENKTHSWFVSFAPYDNPTIATAVLVEGGGEGNSAALPVTQDVLQWYFSR